MSEPDDAGVPGDEVESRADGAGEAGEADEGWRRLDTRMLLVHPIRELIRFLPALIPLAIAGSASDGPPWQLIGLAVPILLGVLRWLTTRYRLLDGRVELRRGLINRTRLTTQLDRVRTVDLVSSPVQRVLGLTTLRIGTGEVRSDGGDGLDLDGLPSGEARSLRTDLLGAVTALQPVPAAAAGARAAAAPEPPLLTFDPRWLRFAPFTTTGLVVVAATLGLAAQVADQARLWRAVDADALAVPTALGLVLLGLGLLVVLLLVSVLGYLVANWGFRLTRAAGAWHLRRGLLTTRETSLDEERVAGVVLGEPLALRLAGGRHLQAIVTGVARGETGSSTLVPPADADVAPRVAAGILGTDAPLRAPLRRHGRAAVRRRWLRALGPALVVTAAVVAAVATGAPSWLLAPAALVLAGAVVLARDRAAGLGHALVEHHLVARSGSLTRRREVLDVDHVIGLTWRATWWQRRSGLCTLSATTAGGRGVVTVLDVPEADALALALASHPDLVEQFVASGEK